MLCKCGCGMQINEGRMFCSGHNNKKPIVKRICPICNNEFVVKGSYPNKKHCSIKCSGVDRRVNRITKTCEICHTQFKVTLKETRLPYRKARFCSNNCKGIYYSQHPDYTGVAKLAKKGVAPPNLKLFVEGGKKTRFNGDIRNKIIGTKGRLNQHFPYRDSSIEIKLRALLTDMKVSYKSNSIIPNRFELGTVDILIPEKKVAIFADGCYWHACKKCIPTRHLRLDKVEHDKMITSEIEKEGWKVLRLWQHDIENNSSLCKNKIMEVLDY